MKNATTSARKAKTAALKAAVLYQMVETEKLNFIILFGWRLNRK